VIDFLLAIIDHVYLALTVEMKGDVDHYFCWYQKTRVIALLCGSKISAVCVFFRFVTKHACDEQTDGQNCDSQDRARNLLRRAVKSKSFRNYAPPCIAVAYTVSALQNIMFVNAN